MTSKQVLSTFALGRAPFKTLDPFLFCVHHLDKYPAGQANMGPDPAKLRSRDLGMDFSYEDGWSMYHGATVPGFPAHPHRGFETVTVTRRGFVDHHDSLGCTARYGEGDTQWMTAGAGIQHSEMFPLLQRTKPNTMELYQIWLNLPRAKKMCKPAFAMLWAETTPVVEPPASTGASGGARVTVVAGRLFGAVPPPPPPDSWGADESNDVGVWVVELPAEGATIVLPPAAVTATRRAVYVVSGDGVAVGDDEQLGARTGAEVDSRRELRLRALSGPVEVLVLQGKPIGEPVVQHGPMVMNTREEIRQAFEDYQQTQYGGWSYGDYDPVHGRDVGRHAVHPDGRRENAPSAKGVAKPQQ